MQAGTNIIDNIPTIITSILFSATVAGALFELRIRRLFYDRDYIDRHVRADILVLQTKVDTNQDKISGLEASDRLHWKPVADAIKDMSHEIRRMNDQQIKMNAQQESMTEVLDSIKRWMADYERQIKHKSDSTR